jgi:hypothetical protein
MLHITGNIKHVTVTKIAKKHQKEFGAMLSFEIYFIFEAGVTEILVWVQKTDLFLMICGIDITRLVTQDTARLTKRKCYWIYYLAYKRSINRSKLIIYFH